MNLTARLILTGAILFSLSGFSQDIIPTKGKEFWVGFMQNYAVEEWQEELNLFITSDQNTTGSVTIPQQGWQLDFVVTANQTTTVNLPNDIAEHFTNQVIEDRGIFVETEDTVAVFAINFNGFTADGTKILPIKSLGTGYRIASYPGLNGYPSEFLVVATEDDTEVEINTTVATEGGNAAGVPFTVQLDRGESYQVRATGTTDFTGTTITGTAESGDCRPFAVFSGVGCTNVYVGCFACDHICEQAFPTETWGTDFYVVPYNFVTDYTYRILADQDNTNVLVNGVPQVLNAGEFSEYNDEPGVVCVNADKPISVIQYMQGADCGGDGDPAMLILNDETQKINNITFATVESTVITQHGLNIIMETTQLDGLTLDGSAISSAEFSTFPNCPSHSYAQLDLPEGSHTLDAPNGFTAYVYGTGGYESYTYSVGSFSPLPPLLVDSVVCTSEEVNLAMEGDFSNVWWYAQTNPEDTIATGPQLVLTVPIIPDIYVAVGDQFISGCSEEQLFSVEVPEPPVLETAQSADEVCQYQEVQLDVLVDPPSNVYEYVWEPANGLDNPNISNPIATPVESTWYYVTVSTPTGCGTNTDSLYIEVTDGGVTGFNVTVDDDLLCAGEMTQLHAVIEDVIHEDDLEPNISWGVWDDISNGIASNDCGSVSGNALYFNGAGERSATTIDLDVSTGGTINFALKIGNGAFPCDNADPGEDVILEFSTNGGGVWDEITTYLEFQYPVFTDISVTIPVAAETASTRFRWRQLANSGNNEDNWALDNIYIGAQNIANYTYAWSPDYNIDDIASTDPNVDPDLTTTYIVEVVDPLFGCVYQDSVSIEVGQPFDIDITPDTALCDVAGIELYAIPSEAGDFSYTWSPDDGTIAGIFSEDPTVSPLATTTYTVDIESDAGCSNSADVTIIVNQLLDLEITTDNNDFCAGESAQLNAIVDGDPPGLEYTWFPADYLDDSNIPNPVSTPFESITYELTVEDIESGCILTDIIELDVFVAFTIEAQEDESVCSMIDYQLNVVPSIAEPLDWQWEPAGLLDDANAQNPLITVDGTQVFTVTATDGGGCSAQDEVEITLLFETFDLGPDIDICFGETTILSTGYDDTYIHEWSTTENTPEIEVGETNNYSVTVTSPEGCSDTDNLNVVVHDLPTVDLGPDQSLCEGEQYVIDALNAGSDFEWSTADNTQAILVELTDTYWVIVTDFWECENSDTIDVVFHENPVINLPEETAFCEDQFVLLDAENPGSTYLWSTDEVSQTIEVNQTGEYTVEVTNEWNCVSTDATLVDVATYPIVDIGPDLAFCEGEYWSLDAGNEDLNINWSTGETSSIIQVTTTDLYSVTVDNDYCFTNDEAQIIFHPTPTSGLPSEIVNCFAEPPYQVNLVGGSPINDYQWSTGSGNPIISAYIAGTYWVHITDPFGCVGLDTLVIVDECYGEFLYIPNAFTPDNDGINDVFRAIGPYIIEFEMQIYDRWGEVIFESDDIREPWLGNVKDGEHYVMSGVYPYVVKYKYLLDEFGSVSDWNKVQGHVTVVR